MVRSFYSNIDVFSYLGIGPRYLSGYFHEFTTDYDNAV